MTMVRLIDIHYTLISYGIGPLDALIHWHIQDRGRWAQEAHRIGYTHAGITLA